MASLASTSGGATTSSSSACPKALGSRGGGEPHPCFLKDFMSTRGKPLLVLAWFLLANLSLALAQGWELRVCADPKNLPYSNQAQQGFDNRIAELLAQALGARLTYDWGTQGPSMVDTQLREGRCDLMMSVGEGYRGLLSSVPYYQSSFAFVYREDSPYEITSLDDEVLHHLRIAIETAGVPPFESLANRGLSARAVILEAVDPNDRTRSPIVEAVAKGEVDVAILWGPVAGYFAKQQPVKLKVVPISPEFEPPALSMVYPLTLGVRPGDEVLRDQLNMAIAQEWERIQAILEDYGVPLVPLPRPVVGEVSGPSRRVRLGLVVPTRTGASWVLSSVYEDAGEAARRGAILAGDELAPQAEAQDIWLEVLPASAPNPEAALRAAERLAAQGAVALIGGLGGQAEVLARVAEARKLLFFNIGDSSDRLRNETCRHYTFHLEASAAMYLDALVAWFTRKGLHRWFLIYADSPQGQALYQRAREALLERGASEVGWAVSSPGQPDYTPLLRAIEEARPEAVLLLLEAQDQLAFLGQYELMGLEIPLVSFPDPVVQTRNYLLVLRQVAPKAGAGERIALWEASLNLDEARRLNERFSSRWGEPTDPSAWAAYAAVKIVLESVLATGSLEPARLVAYLEDPRTRFDLHKGTPLSFRPWDHQLRQPLYLVRLNPEAEIGIRLSQQLALAQLVAQVPEIPSGADPLPILDQLGDSAQRPSCR
jgi:quinoprotein dehydrogenase-associated probable ABC transporter substrate-binding protein